MTFVAELVAMACTVAAFHETWADVVRGAFHPLDPYTPRHLIGTTP